MVAMREARSLRKFRVQVIDIAINMNVRAQEKTVATIHYGVIPREIRPNAVLINFDVDVADARVKLFDARFYLIYFFAHKARNAVGIVRKKTLELPEILSPFLVLLFHRAPSVYFAQERAAVEFHLAFDAIHAPPKRRRFKIDDLLNGRVGFEYPDYLFLQLLGYRAAQEIYAIFEDERDCGEGKKYGDEDGTEGVPNEISRQVRRANRDRCYRDTQDGDCVFEIHRQGHRVGEF